MCLLISETKLQSILANLYNMQFFALILSGSGKTAAFLIPMFERLKTHSAKVRHNQRNSRKLKTHFRRTDFNSDDKNERKLSLFLFTNMYLYFKIKYNYYV